MVKVHNSITLATLIDYGTQLNVKKDDIKADDTSEEMLEYVQRLYIHEQVAPIMY